MLKKPFEKIQHYSWEKKKNTLKNIRTIRYFLNMIKYMHTLLPKPASDLMWHFC